MQTHPSAHERRESGIIAKTRERILVVDDDIQARTEVATTLREDGYSVVEAEDASEVFTQLAAGFLAGRRHGGFDAILCREHSLADKLRHAFVSEPIVVMMRLDMDELRAALEAPEEEEDREEPIFEVVATRGSLPEAIAVKTLLHANGVDAFLVSHVVHVLARDAERARAILLENAS